MSWIFTCWAFIFHGKATSISLIIMLHYSAKTKHMNTDNALTPLLLLLVIAFNSKIFLQGCCHKFPAIQNVPIGWKDHFNIPLIQTMMHIAPIGLVLLPPTFKKNWIMTFDPSKHFYKCDLKAIQSTVWGLTHHCVRLVYRVGVPGITASVLYALWVADKF